MYKELVLIIGVLILVKGTLAIANPKWTKKMIMGMINDKKFMRTAGMIGIVLGALLVWYSL